MIIRVKKRVQFVQVEKTSVKDPRLSLKATGLLTLLLSFPDDWKIDHRSLARKKPDGEHTFRAALKELERCGYLKRRRVQDSRTGRWSWEHILYEVSKSNPARVAKTDTREGPSRDSPSRGFPSRGNRDSNRELRQIYDSPSRENRHSEQDRPGDHSQIEAHDCELCSNGWIEGDDGEGWTRCPNW